MTNATGRRELGFAGILLGLVVGCSSAADSGSAPAAQLTETGFTPVTESLSDPGYCGYLDLGVDQAGNQQVEEERYYYPVINRRLAENPDLQLYTGLSTVSSCADARQFVKASNEYQAAAPASSVSKADLLANFPIIPAEPPKRDPKAPVQKIFSDQTDAVEEVIGFGFVNSGKTLNCTGTRLAGALFLTAAHCLSIANHPAAAPYIIAIPKAWMKHIVSNTDEAGDLYQTDPSRCQNLKKNEVCTFLALDGYMNPNYAGTNDYANDVAVLHVRNDSQQFIRTVSTASKDFATDVAFLSTVTPKIGDSIVTVGWGPNGNLDKGTKPNQYFMRAAAPLPIATMDGLGPSMQNGVYVGNWISTTAADQAQLCQGDSGGPYYNEFSHEAGITSFAAVFDPVNKSCAKIGAAQFAARVDYQAFSFIPKAMLTLQDGSDSTLCTCAFSPSLGDSTGKDPEAAGAHIRCNVGCEDPSQWTQ